ncbi:MAG: two-component sensor histidine kinase [Deltaproteobacteria bacterium]|nr:two-component sensor histidine kinase [Deltaproteobacteria bacterium]MBW1978712.1 two-component sensor histidine kinase [Deltaproteobacteria bacterium]
MNQKKRVNSQYYHALTRTMVLVIMLVSFAPMFLVSGIVLYQFRASYEKKVFDHLGELVQKHAQNIDSFLKEKLADIRFLAETFGFEDLSDESFLRDRLETLQRDYGPVFVDLGVVNAQGLQVAYAGPFKLEKAIYYDADWFKEAMKTRYFISDVFLGLRGLPHFVVAVRDNYKGEHWILRATIDFVAFNSLVENIHVGKTGFAFILNTRNELQTKPRIDIEPEIKTYNRLIKEPTLGKGAVHVVEARDVSGKKKIYVIGFLKHREWMMVFQQDSSDAFSDLTQTMKLTALIIVLGALGIMITAVILAKRMVGRIAKVDSEKERMNEQIIQAGKLVSVGELAAGIAHEINNPVAIMVEEAGWIGDLLEEEEFKSGSNLDEFKRAVNQIKTQGRRCKEITHKLLSFARKTDPRIQNVQLNDLIGELVELSAQRARYARVTINTRLEQNLPYVKGSQSELQQVFLNLINNALDAMEKEGGALLIQTNRQGDHVVIELSDTGPGIPEANLKRIFDPFFTTKPVGKGTGLGLSICYGIIKKMGGEIRVASSLGKGTTFTVILPTEVSPPQGRKA